MNTKAMYRQCTAIPAKGVRRVGKFTCAKCKDTEEVIHYTFYDEVVCRHCAKKLHLI